MGMKKDKPSSEVCHANDATWNSTYEDNGSFSASDAGVDKLQLSVSRSDNLLSTKDADDCSLGSSENKLGCRTSNNTSEGVELLQESDAKEMVIDVQLSSKLPPFPNENVPKNKYVDVARPNNNEDVGARAAKSGNMDLLCGRVVEKKSPCSSAAANCLDQESIETIIDQAPSCCPDIQDNAALDPVNPLLDTKDVLVGSSPQASAKGQPGEDDIDGKQSVDCLSCPDRDEQAHEISGPDQLADINKHSVISSPESEGDESDLEEQDVKVCDICGDAGREDLLAICSRCSDGAEHTYCMREMLDKVPEGHWLCEECKSNEEMEKQRQGHPEILDRKERSKQNSDSFMKLDKKDPVSAGTTADNDSLAKHLLNKRRGSDIEDPAVKRQVLESMVQSTTTSSPGRNCSLSRDNSFKNLDKMNAKVTHQTYVSGSDGMEKPRSPNANVSHVVKGSFLKSNSFGTSSPKPKVKMVVEIPQKHKQGVDVKDVSNKIIGKSTSFKGNLSRSNTTESKVKMLSPKDSHILESRGVKQAKDRNLFERKNSVKLDHSSVSQLVVSGCKNQVRGDVRRQHSSYPSGGGSSSTNGTSGLSDARSSPCLKEGCTSSLSRLDGVNNNNEKSLDRSIHSRQGVSVGVPNVSSRNSASDTSSVRSLKDGANEENKLKAAIQAAMQKRLDMCKKNKVSEKSNMMPLSNMDSANETTSLDRPNSMNSRNSVSAKGICEGEAASESYSYNCGKESYVNDLNQSKVFPADATVSSQARDLDLVSSYIEQMLSRSPIPEHEFAWLGSFEVYRSGKSTEHISGIQAHLSTCASYKVLEMVKKFPHKVPLNEVPRSCTWPTQFQDSAEEDNVAVYFFAKDAESYERSYKNLLEKMMKDDLALKGNIDDIELLIFPSKQLTKRSQRWNMLFFIWGVFRGRKENCLEKFDFSTYKALDFISPVETPTLYGSVKENVSITMSDEDVGGRNVFASGVLPGKQSPIFSNGNFDSGKHSPHQTSSYEMQKCENHDNRNESQTTCYHPETSLGTRYKSTLAVGSADLDSVKVAESQASLPTGGGISSLKAEMVSGDHTSVEEANSFGSSSKVQTVAAVKDEGPWMKIEETAKEEGFQSKLNKEEVSVDAVNDQCQIRLKDNSRQVEYCKETKSYQSEVKLECRLKKEEADMERSDFEGINTSVRDVKMEDVRNQQLLDRKHPQQVFAGSFKCPTVIGQKSSLNDMNVAFDGGNEESINERYNISSLFRSGDTSTHDVCSASTPLEKRYKVAFDDKEMPTDLDSAENFFPVKSHPAESIQSRDNSSCWKLTSSGKDDNLTDGSPNLELALGVEKRTKSGFFLGLVDGERFQLKPPDLGGRKEDEEEGSAALSLSLAFPFANKERSVSRVERAFPERQRGE